MDVQVEVGISILHCDVDVSQLDLIAVVEVVVLLLCQDDVANLDVILTWWTCPEVPEDDVLEVPIRLRCP